MRELLPGLFHWTAEHPNIGQEISSHYLRDGAAVIDPLTPSEGTAAVRDLGAVRHVVLSCRHHDRDHAAFVQEFGAAFHVSEAGVNEYPGEQTEAYAIGDEIVSGITAAANGPIAPDDTLLRLDVEAGALLFADSLLRTDGELSFMPDSLLGDDPDQVRATSQPRWASCSTSSSITYCSPTATRSSAAVMRHSRTSCTATNSPLSGLFAPRLLASGRSGCPVGAREVPFLAALTARPGSLDLP